MEKYEEPEKIVMAGVEEWAEGYPVILTKRDDGEGSERHLIEAANEGGFNHTQVDLLQLIQWLRENRPDLLKT